jgi:UDP-N-acetylmuramate--alanine ligase
MAVVLNIEPDHLDCYDDFDHLKESFLTYINRVPFYGSAIIPDDDPNVLEIMPRIARPYATFGFSERADYRAEGLQMKNGRSVFTVSCRGEMLGQIEMKIPGRHNVSNAMAAIAASSELDIPFETIANALREFSGVERRFEFVGEVNDIIVIDDYAHHPSEIRAALETARENYDRRLIAVFQPHLFSRTRDFMDEFAEALSLADKCILTDIYPAREEPIEGITSESIIRTAAARGVGDFTYVGVKANAAKAVAEIARPGDIVMIMGAGSITHIRQELLQRLEQIK